MSAKYIFIKKGDLLTKFTLEDIYFFTRSNNKTIAIFSNKNVEIPTSLYNLSHLLEGNTSFIRTHKSFIVNKAKIKQISRMTPNTYNIKFFNIASEAFITKDNLKLLKEWALLV